MKRWLTALIPLTILSILIAWRLHENKAVASTQAVMRVARLKSAPTVSVALAQVREIRHTLQTIGTVEAPLDIKLSSKVTGRIVGLDAQPGDRVTPNELVIRIDPSDIAAQVQQQQAALVIARDRLAQAQLTQKPAEVSVSSQLSQQQAAVSSAEANYNQVQADYAAQVGAADAAVTDMQGRVDSAGAAIDNSQAQIRSAQANLDNAKSQYNRTRDLYKSGFIAAQDVDTATTAVKVQQADLDVARSQLKSTIAARDSAAAQLDSARRQAEIARRKGTADIASARAQLSQAQSALEYARANMMQGPAYQQNLAALQAAVNAARASLADSQVLYAETMIRSPIDGVITARYMDPGAVATPGQPILAVRYIRQVWITAPVQEEELRKLSIGRPAQLTFDALPGRTFTGRISQIPPSADPISRQFPVRITLDNPAGLVKPGMFARVTIVTDQTRAVVVPPEAIQQGKGSPAVLAVQMPETAETRDQSSASESVSAGSSGKAPTGVVKGVSVVLGPSDANGVAILEGVQPGERVVTLSAGPLKDGQKVRLSGGR